MIRVAFLANVMVFFLSAAASAQPITVRSGDHDGFTRVVLRLPENTSWQISEEPGLKTISLTRHEAGFDTARVFDIVPREFLVDVRAFPSRLELVLSCACELNTFVERQRFLVLDILDGPPLTDETAAGSARFIPARPASGFNFGDLLWSEFSASDDLDSGSGQAEPTQLKDNASDKDNNSAEMALIEETRQQLLAGLANAASRGIVQPSTPSLELATEDQQSATSTEIFDSSEETVVVVTPELGNIRITSSRDNPQAAQNVDLMTSGALCPSPGRVMVAQWGTDEPFHEQLALSRQALFSEIDRLNEQAAVDLTRLYIFFGFGAEAKQTLALSEDLAAAHPELMDLADVMENGFARNPRFIHRFSDCDSDLALWAAMAAQELPADQVLNEAAALRALAALPDHLQRFIAPALSKRLAEHGSLEAASIALRNIEWNNEQETHGQNMARATIEAESGNSDQAEALLEDVIEDNAEETPEAMMAFVESRLAEGETIPADVALLIETYAFERRESPIGQELQRTHVIASAYSGQFSKAFEALQSPLIKDDPEFFSEVQSHVFSALSANADDIEFLDGFFTEFPDTAAQLSTSSIEATTSRLLALGFTTEVEQIFRELPTDGMNNALRLIHAKALLELRQPEAASTVLSLVDTADSTALRAEALAQLGENREAFDLFQSVDANEDAMKSAWLANEWSELVPSDTPVLGSARGLSEEDIPTIPERDGMLQSITSAVEQSDSARTTLQEILESLPVEP